MARNSELVRQWEILRAIDGARYGIAIGKLASERGVHQRTIRRDLDALGRAGFPVYDEKVNGTSMWKLRGRPFSRLEETGLGVMELCALYFGRTLFDTLAGAPLLDDGERAFAKVERALPVASRRFLDQLPRILTAKRDGRKKHDERRLREILGRVLDATLLHRTATMRYASAASARKKEYVVECQRMAYAHGGLYMLAWVPEYDQMRTFAAERIETFALMDDRFQPRPLPVEPFGDSLGVNTGRPETIVIEFSAAAAPHVREREWHRSQQIANTRDGGVICTLQVCNDQPLLAWILGFGGDARVVSPAALAEKVYAAADGTRRRYLPTPRSGGRAAMLSMKTA